MAIDCEQQTNDLRLLKICMGSDKGLQEMLHTKSQSSIPSSFREEKF